MSTRRVQKVSELILQQLSSLIRQELSEDYGLITVTDVILTPDLREAKVFFSCFEKKNEPLILKDLDGKIKFFQQFLGRKLQMKFTPRLKFEIDKNLDKVDRIEEIIDEINKK